MTNTNSAQTAQTNPSAPSVESPPLQGAFSLLLPKIQQAISEEGYTTPTPIQEQCIHHLLAGKDLLGSAQTGTGKTAAFTLPMLQELSKDTRPPRRKTPRALILAPTRELAAQIGDSIKTYGKHLRLSHTVIFGGVNQAKQVKAMTRGVDILVATPGRLLDLMNQGYIDVSEVEVFVLDEVDRMLDMGFIHDINRVLKKLPENRQTLFFSATMPPKMIQLASTMVKNPERVTIAPDQPAVERISQKVLFVNKKNKDVLLAQLLGDPTIKKAIVFTQMKHVANRVVGKLDGAGIDSAAIHGNKSQAARTKALDGFKQGRFNVLVATDVAARGIDIDDVTHVFNYDLPMEAETYVHRIGRTARAGSEGASISFCSAEEKAYLNSIEKLLKKPIPPDMGHKYHCQLSFTSTQAAPKNFGRGSGGGGGGGGRGGGGRNSRSGKSAKGQGWSRGRSQSRSRNSGAR